MSAEDPKGLAEALGERLGISDPTLEPVAGGSINSAYALLDAGAERAFVKTRAEVGRGEYSTEAAGLRWLAGTGELGVPEVLALADGEDPPRFLALSWIESGAGMPDPERLGRGLAELHAAGARFAGESPPGSSGPWRIGPLELPRIEPEQGLSWARAYAELRLAPLLRGARERGAISGEGAAAVEAVIERIEDLAGPEEPPARLHGDLWSGNVLVGRDGAPWLIDPAACGGHREVDLAMLELFGSPGNGFYAAYEDRAPLTMGWRVRLGLWQLLPLLVHAVLFGGGYGAAAERAARRYL